MNTLHFYLVRECAKTLVSSSSLPDKWTKPWSELLRELEPMNWGRLLCFYAYMERCNVTVSEQYKLHKVLCATYPDHYPSTWWMLGQVTKFVVKNILSSFTLQPWATSQVGCVRLLSLIYRLKKCVRGCVV